VKLRFTLDFCMLMALTAFGLGFVPGPIVDAGEAAPVPQEDVHVLASGPIHEAFAEAVALDPEPGIVAPKAPPALIEEIPPNQKPEGDVQWVSGYWAWDDERNEYIWVSGIWRVPPPDRQWVPGYWNLVTNGYQWVSGYWTSVKDKVTEYLPEPPESVEVGPSSNAPSPDYIWIPGCWLWHYGRYAWGPGYWAAVRPDWVWVPAHYNWTPRGYIFVGGYWDYTIIHRGILFAPVFFPSRVRLGFTFSFSPGFVIDLNIFNDALFLRPRYCHYYYGDYYAPKYYRRGIYPWFSLHARRVVYDPLYAHQRWNHRNDHEWENRLHSKFRERREHEGSRPPRSFDHRTGPDKAGRSSGPAWPDSVMPLDQDGKNKAGAYRFRPLKEKERMDFMQREKEVRTYQKERQSRETRRQNMPGDKASKRSDPNKEEFSRSPIMDRSNEKADRKIPPALFQAPKPNPHVEPLQRRNGLSRSWDRPHMSKDGEEESKINRQRSIDTIQKSGNRGGLLEYRMRESYTGQERGNDGRKRLNER